jgi:hypothetical protein
MPTGTRIRANNVYGVISDNPLSAASATFNSISLPLLPVIAGAHAVVVFDPKRVYGDPEIVVVTAHTAASTVATILRAQYGTSQRLHPQGTSWAHVPVNEDWIQILSSTTRPSNPYEGQFIFEMDTNKLYAYGGVDWAPRDAGGQLNYAQIIASQAAISTETDITGLSITVTVGTARRIKISAEGFFLNDATAGQAALKIYEGVTTLVDRPTGMIANENGSVHVSTILTPTAGFHTYKIRATKFVGAGTVTFGASATQPAYILAEDIGAA